MPDKPNQQTRAPGQEAAGQPERAVYRRAAAAAAAQPAAGARQAPPAQAGGQPPAHANAAQPPMNTAAQPAGAAAPQGVRPAGGWGQARPAAPAPYAGAGMPARPAPGVGQPLQPQAAPYAGQARPGTAAPPAQAGPRALPPQAAAHKARQAAAAAAHQAGQRAPGSQAAPGYGAPGLAAGPAHQAGQSPAVDRAAPGQTPPGQAPGQGTPGRPPAARPAPPASAATAQMRAAVGLAAPGAGGAPRDEKPPFDWKHFAGNLLYTLGFAGEYHFLQLWRGVRLVAALAGQLLFWAARGIGRALLKLAKGVGQDLAAPFVHFRRKLRQARRLREKLAERQARQGAGAAAGKGRALAGARAKMTLALGAALLRPVLPVLAAIVLVATVYTVVNVEYALAVEVDGTVLGYVRDQAVVENAKGLLRERIKLAGSQQVTDWQLQPTYTLGQATGYTTTHQLVNEILRSNFGDDNALISANGLYLDNTLYAVTTEGEKLAAYLESRLEAYRDPAEPEAEVSFVRKVTCDLNPEDVFFAASVVPYEELIERLEAEVSAELRYTAAEGDTLDTIAHGHDITLEALLARNPALAGEAGDFEPEPGTSLLIRRAQPFLQVQTTIRRSSVEPIPYNTVEQPAENKPVGYNRRIQAGVEGEMEVWDDYYYVDGELQRTERVEDLTVVLTEPVDQINEVGTLVISANTPAVGGYGGYYMFPVPDSPYSSRGFGGHRGMDINAAYGAPIYACEGGTVVEAGWHWSWGNYVRIEHPGGISTLYGHCSALYVTAGQEVGQGQYIADVGATGVATGNHCHLEVWVNGGLVDPVAYVGYPYG